MRFYGEVGYGESTETSPGVWVDVITEVAYRGDVIRDIRKISSEQVNLDLSLNNAFSVVADEYIISNASLIKYVVWQGTRWTVSSIEIKPPRLILYIGGVYNGPTP